MEDTLKTCEYLYLDSFDERNNSTLDCQFVKYPDGQQNIRIFTLEGFNPLNQVEIRSRFTSFKDLERIILATKALRELGCERIALNIPYLLGARSDRKFVEGGVNYLCDVIAPILNSLDFNWVSVHDVHNLKAAECINNLVNVSNIELVTHALETIYGTTNTMDFVLVCPDEGAWPRMQSLLPHIGYSRMLAKCKKKRDIISGQILGIEVPEGIQYVADGRDLIIVDDICDGGATFIAIAEEIRKQKPDAKIYLIVTHGIFSKGFKELRKHFTTIFTTNSICEDYAMEFPEMEKGSEIVHVYRQTL